MVETAFSELAKAVGAEGSCPEREMEKGPDCLWRWAEFNWVIECKTQNKDSIHKKDSGQLHDSLQWFFDTYGKDQRAQPLMITPVTVTDGDAHLPEECLAMSEAQLFEFLDALEGFYHALIANPGTRANPKAVKTLQEKSGLTPEQILKRFTNKLRKK